MSRQSVADLALRRQALVARSALQRETLRIRLRQVSAPVQQAGRLLSRLRPFGLPLLVAALSVLGLGRLRSRRPVAAPRRSLLWRALRWVVPAWQAYRGLVALRRH